MKLSMLVFSVLVSLGIASYAFATFSISLFSSTPDNNTVLEDAQRSLDANQEQSTIVSPEPPTNPAVTDNIQDASEITKLTASKSKYENNDYGISINFPSNWKPSEVNLGRNVIVVFDVPETGDPLSVSYMYNPAWLLVASQQLPGDNTTLDDYIKFMLKDLYQNASEYRIISSSKTNLAGLESETMIMYEYGSGESLKVMRNVAIDPKSNNAYIVKYTAHPGVFSKYLPLAQQTMDSFVLTK